MLKLAQPITAINGFKIGDKVRLKDGDGREHVIKSFSIDGMKEFFFEVQFEDGADAMLDNIALLPSNLDEAANEEADDLLAHMKIDGDMIYLPTAKALMIALARFGAEWMAEQGDTVEGVFKAGDTGYPDVRIGEQYSIEYILCKPSGIEPGDEVLAQIRKK